MIKGYGLILLLFSSYLIAEDLLTVKNNQAQAYVETNQYSKAIQIYSELLNDPLKPWQAARLHYNLGLLKLSQNQPKEALSDFLKIDLMLLPLEVVENVFFYEANAYLKQAEELQQSNAFLANLKLNYLFQKSLNSLEKAKKASCLLTMRQNELSPCKSSPRIQNIENILNSFHDAIQQDSKPAKEITSESENKALLQLIAAQDQAKLSLKMSYQLDLESDFNSNLKADSLSAQQQQTIRSGAAFIPAAINEQKNEFLHKKASASCQISKWNDVLHLFDQGYDSAKKSLTLLSDFPNTLEELIEANESTVQSWQKAIDLLQTPPQPLSPQSSNSEPTSAANIDQTIQEIQEMFSQDQSKHSDQAPQKDLQSW